MRCLACRVLESIDVIRAPSWVKVVVRVRLLSDRVGVSLDVSGPTSSTPVVLLVSGASINTVVLVLFNDSTERVVVGLRVNKAALVVVIPLYVLR